MKNIKILDLLNFYDWLVFLSTLLLTFISIWYGNKISKSKKNSNSIVELLVMGRRLTLPLFVATLVATWYGGIFGVTAISYEQGIYNFLTQGIFWYIAYIIFALFIVDKIAKYNSLTLPNLIDQMFGKKSSYLSAIFNFFNVVPITYLISLGLFTKAIFGGSLLLNMSIGITVVVLYSMYGGFKSIVFSDFIQFFVMCISVLIVFLFSVFNYGGLSFLKQNLPAGHFDLLGAEPISSVLIWGFIALATLIDPNFYQRCFAATSTKVAKKGIFISVLIWIIFDICTTGGALYARAVMPDLAPKNAYLFYAINLLPNGLKGLFLGGILATILSTIDSYIFIASSTITYDLLPKRFHSKYLHYFGLIIVGCLALVMAMFFNGNIKHIWKSLGSLYSSTLLIPVLYGYFMPKKLTDNQFFYSCLFGIFMIILSKFIVTIPFISNMEIFYIGTLSTSSFLFLSNIIKNKK